MVGRGGVGLHLNSIGCANNSTLANGSVSHDQVREALHSAAKPTKAPTCADGPILLFSYLFFFFRVPTFPCKYRCSESTRGGHWLRRAEHTVELPRSDLSVSSAVHKQKPRLNETAAICRIGPAMFWSQADLLQEGQLA